MAHPIKIEYFSNVFFFVNKISSDLGQGLLKISSDLFIGRFF